MTSQNVAFLIPIVHEFLQDAFGPKWPDVWVCGVAGDPNKNTNWRGGRAGDLAATLSPQENLFYSVSVLTCDRRKAENFAEARIIVIDDIVSKVDPVAVKAAFGLPRWAVWTSLMSRQWVYRLKTPITDPRIFSRIMQAIAAKGWTDPGTIDFTRAMRLPAGINGKAKYGSPSPVVTAVFDPTVPDLDIADLCLALGLDPIETLDPDSYQPLNVSTKAGGKTDLAMPDIWVRALQELGRVLGPGREAGVIDIECPFSDEHTAREDSGTSYFGGGAFKCHHGHCQGRTNWSFKEKIRELVGEKNGANWMPAAVFECDAIDDEVVETLEKTIRKATGTDAECMTWTEVFARYVYLVRMNRYLDTASMTVLEPTGFNAVLSALVPFGSTGQNTAHAKFINSRGGRGGLGHPEFADGVTYKPGGPARVAEDNLSLRNQWRPADMRLPRQGTVTDADVKVWLDHMRFIFPDGAALDVILDWMSFIVQNPGKKVSWAPLIHGGQGSGKDTAFQPVFDACGKGNVSYVMPEDLTSQFRGWLKAQVIVMEEFAAFGKVDLYNSMKTLIAAPPNEVRINEKFVPAYTIPNKQCYVGFSNKDDAVQVEHDDRRFWIYSSPAKKQPESYYKALWDWYRDQGGIEQVVGWLRDRKIGSSFNPDACPADTLGHKRTMAIQAAPGPVAWVISQFEPGGRFEHRELITPREVVLAGSGVRGHQIHDKHVLEGLRCLGGSRLTDNPITSDLGRVRVWTTSAASTAKWAGSALKDIKTGLEREAANADL